MRGKLIPVLSALCMVALSSFAAKPQDPTEKVKWVHGPATADLGSVAQVRVPGGYIFANASDTRKLMEAMQNPTSGTELGFVAPESMEWFAVYEFDDVGYVKDDEKTKFDNDAMLKSIRAGTEAGNKERKKRGWPTMTISGWEQTPHYDEATHNLEWAIRGESEGKPVVNFNTRVLGRAGVMRVTLVTDPDALTATIPKFKETLAGFDYKTGAKYTEYRSGDKIAKYGLSALVVGGAAAVAVKSGLLKYIWKFIVIGVVAVGGLFKKMFGSRSSSDQV
jgi:uncharacterized membrane-anchored protein